MGSRELLCWGEMCRAEQVVTGEDSACHGSVQSETERKTKLRFLVGALGLLAGRTRASEGQVSVLWLQLVSCSSPPGRELEVTARRPGSFPPFKLFNYFSLNRESHHMEAALAGPTAVVAALRLVTSWSEPQPSSSARGAVGACRSSAWWQPGLLALPHWQSFSSGASQLGGPAARWWSAGWVSFRSPGPWRGRAAPQHPFVKQPGEDLLHRPSLGSACFPAKTIEPRGA